VNRRAFIGALGSGALALGVLPVREALAALPRTAFAPISEVDRVSRAINRLTYGPTPELFAHVQKIGVEAFIAEQLNPDAIDDSALASRAAEFEPILSQNGGKLAETYKGQRGEVGAALYGNTFARALYSQRQLYERMVDFWGNHFSMFIGPAQVLFLKVDDDRDAIRPHALGKFRDLLGASAHSPAMLVFLDNAKSTKDTPNENYARELMELHTLGVHGGYTEDDVKAVARALTGWSVVGPKQSNDGTAAFRFRKGIHDRSAKTVLGQAVPAGGEDEGEKVLDILAAHPSTAAFISAKLVRRFVADQPPQPLVDACAQTYLNTGGDIRQVLATIFASNEFWSAPPKFKAPYEYAMSIFRALNYDVQKSKPFLNGLRGPLGNMGQIPFTWPAPNGFPDVGDYWDNNLLARWNMAVDAADGRFPGAVANPSGLPDVLRQGGVMLQADSVFAALAPYLFGRPLTAQEEDIVMKFARANGGSQQQQANAGIALMLASPAFQYR
jgi:uncharacterized protein (DUF1800 family)